MRSVFSMKKLMSLSLTKGLQGNHLFLGIYNQPRRRNTTNIHANRSLCFNCFTISDPMNHFVKDRGCKSHDTLHLHINHITPISSPSHQIFLTGHLGVGVISTQSSCTLWWPSSTLFPQLEYNNNGQVSARHHPSGYTIDFLSKTSFPVPL